MSLLWLCFRETIDNKTAKSGVPIAIGIAERGRNRNWVAQFDTIAPKGSILFAVGAGHLPGDAGVLELLRKKGYIVTPLKN